MMQPAGLTEDTTDDEATGPFVLRSRTRFLTIANVAALVVASPLIFAALISWVANAAVSEAASGFVISYAALILAGLAGLSWGLGSKTVWETVSAAAAGLMALTALGLPLLPGFCVLIAAHLLHGLKDLLGVKDQLIPVSYGWPRLHFTVLAVLFLLVGLMPLAFI